MDASGILKLSSFHVTTFQVLIKLTVDVVAGVKDVILILHNIDGPSLQSRKVQIVLCMMARIPGVHIVASADHVNGSLCKSFNVLL